MERYGRAGISEMDDRFALLIDADNVSAKYIKPILDELSKYGNVTYKRIYGDWTSSHSSSWKEVLLQNSISPIQQFSYTHGKNATDSAMIIDAMDILYGDKVDGFCICSSDSDFTRLAARLRESGKQVIGMGEKAKETKAFANACETFKFLDLIYKGDGEEKQQIKDEASENEIKNEIQEIIDSSEYEGYALASFIGESLKRRHSSFDPRNYGCKN